MPNGKQKLLFLFGTRPEVIKLAPVIIEATRRGYAVEAVAVEQHTDLLEQALLDFSLTAKRLPIARVPGDMIHYLSHVIPLLSQAILASAPDWVLVQGDTMTTYAAAMVANLNRVKLAHVEAGLRTQDRGNPFPEEMFRQCVARMADLHCAPTEEAVKNLHLENVPGTVTLCGNPVIDAMLQVLPKNIQKKRQILCTIHRREHSMTDLMQIFMAVNHFAEVHPEWEIIVPLHPSPRVQAPAREMLRQLPNVKVPKLLPYPTAIQTIAESAFVVTDSGGIQEEAAYLGIPTIVCRHTTERTSSLQYGTAVLAGTAAEGVFSMMQLLAKDEVLRQRMSVPVPDVGRGSASQRILTAIEKFSPVSVTASKLPVSPSKKVA